MPLLPLGADPEPAGLGVDPEPAAGLGADPEPAGGLGAEPDPAFVALPLGADPEPAGPWRTPSKLMVIATSSPIFGIMFVMPKSLRLSLVEQKKPQRYFP